MKRPTTSTGEVHQRIAGIVTILCLLSLGNTAGMIFGQDSRPFFLGFQPAVTKEPFYEPNAFDVNVLPLVIQFPVSKLADLRLTTIASYHIGKVSAVSDIGFQVIAPIYVLPKKEGINERSRGFYLGPLLGVGRNLKNDHLTITCGVEPGYLFPAKNRFTVSLGLQLGGSYFIYDERNNILRSHFGFKVNLGFWRD